MSERRNESSAGTSLDLRRLRDRLKVEAAREQTYPVCLTSRQCLDLLEAVERARFLAIPWVVDAADGGDQCAEDDLARLRRAFDRFTFAGEDVDDCRLRLWPAATTEGGTVPNEPHVCRPEQTDEQTATCPVCHAVYTLDEEATADERSYVNA